MPRPQNLGDAAVDERVRVTRHDAVAHVLIDNPPLNALDAGLIAALTATFDELALDNDCLAGVIEGAGERAFVAGADIREFVGLDAATAAALSQRFQSATNAVASAPFPVVAAIRGFCLGGGLELALACDFRIAAATSALGMPEIRLGLLPGGGGTQRLPRVIGPTRARMLALLGEPVDADTAAEWGLVDRVVAAEMVAAETMSLAEQLAARSPTAIRELKALFNASAGAEFAGGMTLEAEAFSRCVESADGREGVDAFLEKRQPKWPSRLRTQS